MGESDRYIEYKHLHKKKFLLGNDNNALMALFTVNVVFFLFLMTIKVSFYYGQQTEADFNQSVLQWFRLPGSLVKLSERPWTLLTYMFSDTTEGLMRLISNMLWLWSFGSLLQKMSGNDKLFSVYLYGGVVGAVFFIVANYCFPSLHNNIDHQSVIGANAAVIAVATATTYLNPDFRFFTHIRKGIPVWVLLTVFLLFDFAGIAGSTSAIYLSHLGGALSGFLFIYFLKKGHDGSIWINRSWYTLNNLFTPAKKDDKAATRKKIFYDAGTVPPYAKSTTSNSLQQKIDAILDKINEQGFEFLTDEEKEILKKASEE